MSDIDSGYQLSVLQGEDRGRNILLRWREAHLGRSAGSTQPHWIYFAEPTVSRHHASLVWDETRRHYTIYHKSHTNPTLVNAKRVLHCPLAHDDVVQIGLLVFRVEYIGTAEDREKAGTAQTPLRPPPNPRRQPELQDSEDQMTPIDSGLRLVVIDGPDRGSTYTLDRSVLFVGRRHGLDDPRGENGILLNDDGLPKEQALLAWNEREQTYAIFQVESSTLPTRILREDDSGAKRTVTLGQNQQELLQPDDVVRMGETAFRVEIDEEEDDVSFASPLRTLNVNDVEPLDNAEPPPPIRRQTGRASSFEDTTRAVPGAAPAPPRLGGFGGNVPRGMPSIPLPKTPSEAGGEARPPSPYDEPTAQVPTLGVSPRRPAAGRMEPQRNDSLFDADEAESPTSNPPEPRPPAAPRPPPTPPAAVDRGKEPPDGTRPGTGGPAEVLRPRSVGSIRGDVERTARAERGLESIPSAGRTASRTPPAESSVGPSSPGRIARGTADRSAARGVSSRDETPPRPPQIGGFGPRSDPSGDSTSRFASEPAPFDAADSPGGFFSTEEHTSPPEIKHPPRRAEPALFPTLNSDFVRNIPTRSAHAEPRPTATRKGLEESETLIRSKAGGRHAPHSSSSGDARPARRPRTEFHSTGGGDDSVEPDTLIPAEPYDDGVEGLDFKDATFSWRYRADFVIGFLEGPNRGQKIELLTRELSDGREITLGSAGERINDIEIDDEDISNLSGTIRYNGGRFTLLNEGPDGSMFLNQIAIGQDEEMLLKTGDRIGLGDSVLIFLERTVVQILSRFELIVVHGISEDRGRAFDLLREVVVVGRNRSCEVTLADPEISRKHMAISLRNGRFYLTHMSTNNPTFINGISLPRGRDRILNEGDKIQLSDHTTLVFRARAEAPDAGSR